MAIEGKYMLPSMHRKRKTKQLGPLLFDNSYLIKLIVPLMGEQFLAVTIGMADTIMVSSCGEVAISGVALVDTLSTLFIQLFAAFATGGAAVVNQYLGKKDISAANQAARQLFYICLLLGIITPAICLPLKAPLLKLLYGDLSPELTKACLTYFVFIFAYFPFLGIFNVGSAIYRSLGNSRLTFKVSILMNATNILLNALFIYHFNMGVAGAGLATFISRVVAAAVLLVLIHIQDIPLRLTGLMHVQLDKKMCLRISSISVPNAIENSAFNIGKLLVQGIISSLGVVAIASGAVLNNLGSLITIPGVGISFASTTIIGQCVGAGEKDMARYYCKKLQLWGMGAMTIIVLFIYPLLHIFIGFYHLEADATNLTYGIFSKTLIFFPLFWTSSFSMPNFIRAAGDAKFTMVVSLASMMIVRVGCAWLFTLAFGWGLLGVWLAMYCDWIVRSIFFLQRLHGNKWLEKKVI
ncbi:MAG: MATE family efflux transporter [Spirochaetia bacterium]|jgi:putative MATE family efflux protein|nr:MATE family efflux transporter [Spirochaetia bacterium]